VVIEGARLGQPDGFPIDGLLDGAREGALYGISVELQSVRHKVDLSSSVCITEMLRGSSSLKFRSRRVDSISPPSSMKAFHRDGSLCSCIMVNPSSDPLELDGGEILSAWSTEERTLPALPSSGVAVHPAPFLGDCVAFLLYRDDRQLLAVQQT
jgi:hypothetical protein